VSETKSKDSPEGLVALGAENGTIVVFSLSMGEVTFKLGGPGSADGHSGTIHHLVFNEQATILYSCSQDKTVIEWDLKTGAVLHRYKGGKTGVTCLCLSPDGSRLLSAGTSLKMWDLSSKKVLRKFAGHSTSVTCLAFSPDGAFFASGAEVHVILFFYTV
jgi:U3 small nucleolar RNA-associated protein 5